MTTSTNSEALANFIVLVSFGSVSKTIKNRWFLQGLANSGSQRKFSLPSVKCQVAMRGPGARFHRLNFVWQGSEASEARIHRCSDVQMLGSSEIIYMYLALASTAVDLGAESGSA